MVMRWTLVQRIFSMDEHIERLKKSLAHQNFILTDCQEREHSGLPQVSHFFFFVKGPPQM